MQFNISDFDHRVATARQLFQEGRVIPLKLVPDSVVRSWVRSQNSGLAVTDRLIFNSVSTGDWRRLEERNHEFLMHAEPEMQRLFAATAPAKWAVACVDEQGFVIKSLQEFNPVFPELATALRPGVNLGESWIGTNAPASAIAEGDVSVVCGHEHFLNEAAKFTCTAVPIFDPSGRLVGALDASKGYDGRRTSISDLVTVAAHAIEDRMVANISGAFCISLHYSAELKRSSINGLLAFSESGQFLGANPFGRQLLGIEGAPDCEFADLFGKSFGNVIDDLRRAKDAPFAIESKCGIRLKAQIYSAAHASGQRVIATQPLSIAPAATKAVYADPNFTPQMTNALQAFAHDVPILINGETGTGKEVLARLLHENGPRSSGRFIAINCSSIPAGLIESELFGYEKGAFTGANRSGMIGKIEQAHGGTLFLDEIGDMPLELQARLLRVLQERQLTRIGGMRPIPLEFSLICATHHDLVDLMARNTFREDLYYRIKGLRIEMPPLRLRSDIDALIDHLLRVEAGARSVPRLSERAREALQRYCWPGNIRELCQALRLGVALAGASAIDLPHLPPELASTLTESDEEAFGPLEHAECEAIRKVFERYKGNVSATARSLGIARATLYRKLKQIGLPLRH